MDGRKRYGLPESQLHQQSELVGCVDAVDIVGRIRFGEPGLLGRREDLGEAATFGRHGAQDIVRGPVDDPEDRGVAIAAQTFSQGANDRDTSADAGLETNPDTGRLRSGKDLPTVLGEKRLVRRHHGLAVGNRLQNEGSCRFQAAHEFDHDVDLRIPKGRAGVVREQPPRHPDLPLALEVDIDDARQLEGRTETRRELVRRSPQKPDHARTDGPPSDDRNARARAGFPGLHPTPPPTPTAHRPRGLS